MARLQAVCVAVRLEVPEHLAEGPLATADLAAAVGADEDALTRLLRFLAVEGWVTLLEDGRFALSSIGMGLRRDDPGGARDYVMACGARGWPTWGGLEYSVITGRPAYEHLFGRTFFEDVAADPVQRAAIGRLLDDGAAEMSGLLAAARDFSAVRVVVDVGGGGGVMLRGLLRAHGHLRGVLLDRPEAIERAGPLLAAAGLRDRCRLLPGDFFREVPAGGDLYLLSWVLHDWDDRQAVAILANCRRAMSPDARLLVLETPMGERPQETPQAVALDLGMLVTTGGRERTVAQYRQLIEAAGLRLARVQGTQGSRGTAMLEVLPGA